MPPPAPAGNPVPAAARLGRVRPPPAALQPLLDDDALRLWRGNTLARAQGAVCPSGHEALDAELPGGGWPRVGLTEVLSLPGSGEMALLAPALARPPAADPHAEAPREMLWISPPGLPYAPALHALGLDLAHLTCLHPRRATDGAWAAEQALRSGRCAWVLWWPGAAASGRDPARPDMLRRLHLAAQEGHTPLVALRLPAARGQSSPAPLRLACEARGERGLDVEVFKRRGPALDAPVRLVLPHPVPGAQPGRPPQPGRPQPVAGLPSERRLPLPPSRDDHAVVLRPSPARAA